MTRSTHTFAGLEVGVATYNEIATKLREAGYDHAFNDDGAIDMHGIGLIPEPERQEPKTDFTLIERLHAFGHTARAVLTKADNDLIGETVEKLNDWEKSFDLYHAAEMRAIKMWHDAGGDSMTWPDKAKLTVWLLEQLDAAAQTDRDLLLQVNADQIALVLQEQGFAERAAYVAVQIANSLDPVNRPAWDPAKAVRIYLALDGKPNLTHVAKRHIEMVKAAMAHGAKKAEKPRPMDEYPAGDIVRLLMASDGEFDFPLADTENATWTIGFNNDGNVTEGEGRGWQIVGWDWNGDDFIQTSKGTPIGWLPFQTEDKPTIVATYVGTAEPSGGMEMAV